MTDSGYADLENRGRSEYGRAGDGDYINPAGQPRQLSTRERARLMRSAGMRPDQDLGIGTPNAPQEFGERLA